MALASSDSESTSIVPIDNRNKSGGVSQNSMSLLGLLQFLWDDSGLNRWYPKMAGKRNHGKVFNLITHSAEKLKSHHIRCPCIYLQVHILRHLKRQKHKNDIRGADE